MRALLVENYRRLQKSDPERIKAELSQLTQVVGTVDLAGPTLTYLLALQGQQVGQGQGELSMRARTELDKTLASLVEATLNPRSELACLRVQQRLLEELASGRPVSQELWLENLACDSEQNTPDPITLRDDLVLDAIDAPASFVYLFDRPPGIAIGFSARIDPSPPQPVIFNSRSAAGAADLAAARGSGGRPHAGLHDHPDQRRARPRLRCGVAGDLGMEVPVLPVLVPGTSFEIMLAGEAGGSADCAALPPWGCSCPAVR